MVARNDIVWADLGPPAGRRPVCVLTRDGAIAVRTRLTCAEVTRTHRDIPTEVEVGIDEGLTVTSYVSCENIVTIPKSSFDTAPIGSLGIAKRVELDQALRFVLDIMF